MRRIERQQARHERYRSYLAARGGALCGLPAAGAGTGTTTEFLPMALLLAGFTAAGVWMFRRWGKQDAPQPAPPREIPMPVGDARPASA